MRTRTVTVLGHALPVTFQLPDGASFDGESFDGSLNFHISIPSDERGFLGRECPECEQVFRMSVEDYDALPDDLRLWCVYCGHNDDHSEFLTTQQQERVMRVAQDVGVQLVQELLDDTFGSMARRNRGGSFAVTYRSGPFFPEPLPGISEEELVRERACESCGVHYAVFGEHRFCPVCGPLGPKVAALDAVGAEQARLDALELIPPGARAELRERGVFDRLYVDAIENVVGLIEHLAKAEFTRRVDDAATVLRKKGGNVFQRLEETADLFKEHLGRDLRRGMGEDWQVLLVLWAGRHVYTHRDGLIDGKYLATATGCTQRVGQRLRVTESDARNAINLAGRLIELLAA
jgi:hypothetical protein